MSYCGTDRVSRLPEDRRRSGDDHDEHVSGGKNYWHGESQSADVIILHNFRLVRRSSMSKRET